MKHGLPYVLAVVALLFFADKSIADVSAAHHALTLRLDPPSGLLEVSDELRVDGSGDIDLYLAENLIITGLAVDGRAIIQDRRGDVLRLDLGAEGQHVISIQYKGRLSRMPENPDQLGNAPMVASESGSYLGAGAAWHPTFDGVAASYRMTLNLPSPQKGVVPGRLIEESVASGAYRAVFQSEIPTQGIVLIAGPFVINQQMLGDITLRTYFPSGLEDLSPGYLESTADYIRLYSQQIGAFPFSSFSIVSGPLPVGLGFPGMTYIGERVVQLPFIRFTSLGHEVLHNWWGNAVEVDYQQGNWAEGLTTYMADYTFAKRRDDTGGKRMRTEWLRDYAALPPHRDRAVKSFISRRHDAAQIIGYNKVAFIFHMLKLKLGNDTFDAAIRKFWTSNKFQTAGWGDIQTTFEKVSGQDLGGFFSQWIERTGAPRLVLSDARHGQGTVSFILSQPELAYTLDVPIKLVTRHGATFFHAAIAGEASRIELPLSADPISVSIDPDFDIFRRLDATEAPPILRDTTLNEKTLVIVPSQSGELETISKRLAERLLDHPPVFSPGKDVDRHDGPFLIIGSTPEVSQFLHQAGLPATPRSLTKRGTARVWAARRLVQDGVQGSLLVVEADDVQAMRSLLRPLPHYRRMGYLIFNGAKASKTGVWPAEAGPLSIKFN